MIKKYTITRDKLRAIYPNGIPLMRTGEFCLASGQNTPDTGDRHFKVMDRYELARCTNYVHGILASLQNSKLGVYTLKSSVNPSYADLVLLNDHVDVEETPGFAEEVKPILDKFMPGRYFIDHNDGSDTDTIYLYYPTIEITNSLGEKHTMKDLVIKLLLNSTGVVDVHGKRFSFTRSELAINYSHSHLHKSVTNDGYFGDFCLGGGSRFSNFVSTLGTCTPGQFELLLVQLEEYIKWESIEGTPHVSMSNLFVNRGNEPVASLPASTVKKLAQLFLYTMGPEHLFALTDRDFIVNPNFKPKEFFELEKKVVDKAFQDGMIASSHLHDYDPLSNTYITDETRNPIQLPAILRSIQPASELDKVIKAFNITPHIYQNEEKNDKKGLIKRLSKGDLSNIFYQLNQLLTYSHTINGKNSISTEGKDIPNTEITVTGNSTPQPVSIQQGVVGAVAVSGS